MPEALRTALAVWHFALGLAVGSFLNVCIYRLPRGLSVTGRSHCPTCGCTLRLPDLVPVLSQLLLRSRCRHCGARFSWRYAAVELACGLMFLALFLFVLEVRGGSLPLLAKLLVCFPCLLAIIIVDVETYTIPDGLLVALAVAGVGYDIALRAMGSPEFAPVRIPLPYGLTLPVPQSLLGGAVGFGGLWALSWLFGRVLGEEAMGFGDVKLLGAAGTLLGAGMTLLAFFLLAVALGAAAGSIAMAARRVRGGVDSEHRVSRSRLPFGPFLAIALAAALLLPGEMAGVAAALYGLSQASG